YEKALFHRAESLRRANRNAEAAADYTKAIALNPKDDLPTRRP
ncbi:MAG: tetratricopeptide repeat protein, partial [Pedobacter sp.]